jgi:NADPH:quinone reductase-like Zn-dependent oxidoreductase
VVVGGDGGGPWTGGFFRGMLRGPIVSMFVGQTLGWLNGEVTKEDLQALSELIEAGSVTPVVGRTFDLVEAADAVRYLAEGHAAGKIVVTV